MTEVDPGLKARVAIGAFRTGLVEFGNFTLRDGSWSPYYVDLRPLPSLSEDPERTDLPFVQQLEFRADAVEMYKVLLNILEEETGHFHHIQSIPEATDHFVGMVGFASNRSVLKRRVKAKGHGIADNILGHFRPGDRTALVDDVISTSGAKVNERDLVEEVSAEYKGEGDDRQLVTPGLKVAGAVIWLNRLQGGVEAAADAGLLVVSGMTLTEFIEIPHDEGVLPDAGFEIIQGFGNKEITKPQDISPTWVNRTRLPVHKAFK